MNSFKEMAAIDCSKHVEKKNGFSYLSWPFAHQMMAERDPDFNWHPVMYGQFPYIQTPAGAFVTVVVTFNGKERQHTYPVLDYRNKPIMEPNAFDVNTSIMRCFVKCCALFGLGLYIYAGEDLPEAAEAPRKITPMPDSPHLTDRDKADVQSFINSFVDALNADVDEDEKASMIFAVREEANKRQDLFVEAWKGLDSKQRAAIKKYVDLANKRRAA